jgi:heme exporter protein D
MPDLGKYAEAVLSAYAVSIFLLIGIVALSLWSGARACKELARIEEAGKDEN